MAAGGVEVRNCSECQHGESQAAEVLRLAHGEIVLLIRHFRPAGSLSEDWLLETKSVTS